ncbi:tetratricopeptide repeat protein [Methylotuvimicrobium buryatense]|uniref:Tetratricopeptide repeat protein n=1 Tax=Methylotuvimicrobium buryatense TaxID=95641 RepID=A0A4P9ULK6_METBY|nr:tetratricopeptide repeat protein [Methylotuvimicrobium buryatense]QCW81997.1 tetratricopeptide repeat protein [Methylotuvimicrobium buryatense]
MRYLKKIIFIMFMILSLPVNANWKSEIDFSLIPEYCKARYKVGDERSTEIWKKRLGKDFIHIHHYCYGLHLFNAAGRKIESKERKQTLQASLNQMIYTKEHSSPNFALQPKISFDIGRVYEGLEEPGKAMKAYQNSIRLNPKVAPPYAAISKLYLKQNNKKEAVAILKKGLKYNPNSKTLKKHLQKLTKE